MTWLNYHHLYYFWTVAKEGTITAACRKLRLAQPTVSTQLRVLEKTLGRELFEHQGRNLVLTETGRMVYRYANDIFTLGHELIEILDGQPVPGRVQLRVGIADVVTKQVAHRLLKPALGGAAQVQLVCFEGKPAALVARLAVHELDIVISDSPAPPEVKLKGFNHHLGESSVSIMATAELARRYRPGFPDSLNSGPFLLPTENTSLRRSLDLWFSSHEIRPRIVAEFEDSALLKVFGQFGNGLFVLPTIIEEEVRHSVGVEVVGRIETVRAQYYAISLEQKLKHPGVVAIVEEAQKSLAAGVSEPAPQT